MISITFNIPILTAANIKLPLIYITTVEIGILNVIDFVGSIFILLYR